MMGLCGLGPSNWLVEAAAGEVAAGKGGCGPAERGRLAVDLSGGGGGGGGVKRTGGGCECRRSKCREPRRTSA